MGRSNVHTQRTTHPPNLAANYFYKNVRPNCQPSPQRGNQWLINGTIGTIQTPLCALHTFVWNIIWIWIRIPSNKGGW